ncbi:glycosyltransferase [Paraclostridium ghonii]|uniref:MGDG synthase family glycosyltransferase n=1 Tax=Paraclostridium ghonii TaxID=29358 RepID=UPI00202D0081|nr:glycosyltransferase [Paeniclostridium ghonii]MCM0168173.1 galactosyldiacylglycerol synthase [Paeniclostridium ghonii]
MNNTKKTILILTAQFGAGHISAANAIKEYVLEKHPTYEVVIQNFISASVPKMNKPLVKLYEANTKYTPGLYNYYYYLKKSFDSRHDIAYKMYTPKLSQYILETNPDLIISTFPMACTCVDYFKTKNPEFKVPTITVVTDVVDSLEWICPTTNMYFVASHEIKNRYVQKGINPNIVKVTGVPVKKDFEYHPEQTYDKHKLLIVGGGRGLFDMEDEFFYYIDDLLDLHNNKLEVTLVCGKNQKLYDKLTQKKPLKNINVLGFVTNMPSLLREHTLLITKPGGATLFESIKSEIPVVVMLPKVGQEIENARFIIDKGIGIVYNDESDLKNLLDALVNKRLDDRINFMVENIINFKNSIDYNKIAYFVTQLIGTV